MFATFAVQIGLLAVVPIPSPVSSRRVWACRSRLGTSSSGNLPADPVAVRLLPLVALAGLLAVLVAVVWPGKAIPYLLPMGTYFPTWLAPAGGANLLAGNVLIAVAVFTLKRSTVFDDSGQSKLLVTGGVFSLMRHPIVSGMGLIYLGFFLVLPSPLVLGGLVSFAWHQQRRLAAEEVLLANRFGRHYRNYRRRVGRFWPCWPDRPEPS